MNVTSWSEWSEWSDRFGWLPKPPWRDRVALMMFLWALRRQPAWRVRHPRVRRTYAWRADVGPIVLVTLSWIEPDANAPGKIEVSSDVYAVIAALIEFTDQLPVPNRPEDDPHYNASLITREDI